MKRVAAFFACLALYSVAPIDGIATATADEAVAYRPPLRGAPARRVGGSSRGAESQVPVLAVLAPDHTGHTVSAQPVLYWYLSQPAPVRVEIALVDEDAPAPLIEYTLPRAEAGIHRVSLAERNVSLREGIEYQWSVALVQSEHARSNDILSGGAIRRVAATAETRAAGTAPDKMAAARLFAAQGLWYDALAAISERIAADPANPQWRRQRAQLLEQAGLADAAAFDRRQAR